ncbi:endo alpha-1,4 polygalactosaminidase [Phenylobacterium montanum]|uniref:Endo alpha-1,4 polygalactosaminidase n=1 Tax=Phenylobacterium montanum TaxID=2823693 RepID=A0A975G1U0_9CAUL|nr:endo alpha-1,4 polygalactosaminidase [Caulobacter sp. S6]QUD89320.1 endo alpha-1,4 polygalactosaminidase [Caulobacter sp. S6]
MAITLAQVQNYLYLVSASASTPNIAQEIASSPAQMVILGGTANDPALNMSVANPSGGKLILDYVDLTEASKWEEPSLFSGSSRPSWFGKANPDWPGVYSVQYWNAAWKQALIVRIDQMIKQGYNGVFLDAAAGDNEWLPGNSFGNPANSNATQALGDLISGLRSYINGLHLSKPFYLIANNPDGVALHDPSALKSLDGIFNETLYYGSTGSGGGATSYALPTSNRTYVETVVGPAYQKAGIPIFGNDYPPTGNLSLDFQSFAAYTAMGWDASVLNASNTVATLTSGPYMFTATAANPTAHGSTGHINFLSGAKLASATLIGGNQGDYFVGGPGHNLITGGTGNDTIYAHPAGAALKNILQFKVVGYWQNAPTHPTLEVLINGKVAMAATAITQNINSAGNTAETFTVNATAFGAITSVKLMAGNTYWTNGSNYDLIFLESASYQGRSIGLTQLGYSSGSGVSSGSSVAVLGYHGVGTISSSALPASPFLSNVSDTINGGGGVNTVYYRGPSYEYTEVRQANGSVVVTALDTAEGPDTLSHIQYLHFTDKTIAINSQPIAAAVQVASSLATVAAPVQTTASNTVIAAASRTVLTHQGVGALTGEALHDYFVNAGGVHGFHAGEMSDLTVLIDHAAASKIVDHAHYAAIDSLNHDAAHLSTAHAAILAHDGHHLLFS